MTIGWQEQLQPGRALREIVQQATAALIQMDAQRLEELARCCADLNRELHASAFPAKVAADLDISAHEIKLLGRVLFETRANLTVFTRLHTLRLREAETGQFERKLAYGDN
jgi:hypothetical protein